MLGALPLWLHIFAATVWVGSQVTMFAVVLPAARALDDAVAHTQLMVEVTARLGWVGVAALVVLIATGIDNIDSYAPSEIFRYRYGFVLAVKVALVAVVIGLTALHTLVLGPRLLDLQSQSVVIHEGSVLRAPGDERDEARELRKWWLLVTSAIFVLSVAILFCAALLRNGWSLHGV